MSGCIFHEVTQVVFPSLVWSSCSPLGLCRFVESWVPLGRFSGQFFLLCAASRRACRRCFNPVCDAVCYHFSSASLVLLFLRIQSSLQDCLHGLLCCLHHHRMEYCCLGRIHHVCCFLLESPRLFRRHESLFHQFHSYFCIFVWMMRRSIVFAGGNCTVHLSKWFLRDFKIASCGFESFLKSIAATHMSVSALSAFLGYEFVRHEVVRCSEWCSESCLVGTLVPIKHGVFSCCIASWRRVSKAVQDRRSACSPLDLSRLLSCILL